jgi:hypothetical protein
MLTDILARVGGTEVFEDAVDCLSNEYFFYGGSSYYEDGDTSVFNPEALNRFIAHHSCMWENGASKVCLCFPDYVLKTSFVAEVVRNDWNDKTKEWEQEFRSLEDVDYCEVEYKVYQAAKEKGLEKFFAETMQIGDSPVYIQEAYEESLDDSWDPDISDEIRARVVNIQNNDPLYQLSLRVSDETLMVLINQNSEEDLIALGEFLDRFDINDLHEGNSGWFHGRLKFIDFCGYGSITSEVV